MIHRACSDTDGASTIEFAVCATAFLLLVTAIIQCGLLFWAWAALQSTAIDAARCASINAPSCKNPGTIPANTQSYAVTAAVSRGLADLTTGDVAVTTGTTAQTACGTSTSSVVNVVLTYQFPAVFLRPFSKSLTASACYPLAS